MDLKMWKLTFHLCVFSCIGKFYSIGSPNNFKYHFDKSQVDYSQKFYEILQKVTKIQSDLTEIKSSQKRTEEFLHTWNETVQPDSFGSYWKTIDGCGGNVLASAGRIYGKSSSLEKASECVWTIQALHRAFIKVHIKLEVQSSYGSRMGMHDCLVREITFPNGTNGPQKFIETTLDAKKSFQFRGPLIFLICKVIGTASGDYIEFEGTGVQSFKNVNFENYFLTNDSGTFSKSWEDVGSQIQDGKAFGFITILFAGINHNASRMNAKNLIIASSDTELCNIMSISITTEFIYRRNATELNCCKMNCFDLKFIISEDYFLLTIGINYNLINKMNPQSPIKLSWEMRPHSARIDYQKCGGIISGRSNGTISNYNFAAYNQLYDHNQRCVWAIHPFPKTKVKITVLSLFVEEGHDHLMGVEMLDNGESRTMLFKQDVAYNLSGRVIFIIFTSDESKARPGFILKWEVINDQDDDYHALLRFDDTLERFTTIHTHQEWIFSKKLLRWPGMHFMIINPQDLAPYTLNMSISYELHGSANFSLWTFQNNLLRSLITSFETPNTIHNNFTSLDSIFILVANVTDETSQININATWNRGLNSLPETYNSCGGTLIGDHRARITYKVDEYYNAQERCTWLVLCPFDRVKLTLIKQAFLCCADNLVIETIDSETGQIRPNSTEILRSSNQSTTVHGPMIAVTFQSNINSIYSSNKGFTLEFAGESDKEIEDVEDKYHLMHYKKTDSEYSFSTNDFTTEKLVVLSYNRDIASVSNGHTSTVVRFFSKYLNQTETTNSLPLYKFTLYAYTYNKSFEKTVECTFTNGKVKEECNFLVSFSEEIWEEGSEWKENFNKRFNFSGFLAVMKLTPKPDDSNSALGFQIDWRDDKKCGDYLYEEHGIIDFSVNQTSPIICVWLIDASYYKTSKLSVSVIPRYTKSRTSYYTQGYLYAIPFNDTLRTALSQIMYIPRSRSYYYYNGKTQWTFDCSQLLLVFQSSVDPFGEGFKLSFNSIAKTEMRPTVKVNWYPKTSQDLIISGGNRSGLGVNDTMLLIVAPENVTDLSVNLENVNLFLNSECGSDSLMFYQFSTPSSYYSSYSTYRGGYTLAKALRSFYRSIDSVCNSTTSNSTIENESTDLDVDPEEGESGDDTVTCNSDPKCYSSEIEATDQNFQLKPPFIAIYKSLTEKQLKQDFHIKWFIPEIASTTISSTLRTQRTTNYLHGYGEYDYQE